jgi:acyl dehydratase
MRENASLEPGFVFPERPIVRDAGDQARWLRAAGVDPAVWDGIAEPTLWGNDGFRGMKLVRQQPNGYVHVEQLMEVGAHVALGEEIRFRGVTESVEPVRKGRMVTQRFEVVRADGSIAVTLTHVGLLPDPAAMAERGAATVSSPEPEPLETLGEQAMTPDRVTTFSREVGNLIHFDPEFARSLGFRAPLAQGLQTMTWMVGALGRGLPLSVRCRFRRPVFWDEPMTLLGRRDGSGRPVHLETRNGAGRPTAQLEVRSGS